MSGVIQKETAVAAGAVNDNLFSGSAFEYARAPGVVSIAAVASATGGFITLQAGPTIILEESPPTVKTAMPTVPDDFLYTAAIAPGDRLVLRARNPTVGALTFRTVAQITDV
jgi:3-hydroxymyristoyl/3-hydroxydecanoyl-(acyl carrier protein) dehydratase